MAISVPIIASFDGRGVSKAIRDFKKLEGAGNKMAFGLLNTNAVVNKGIAQFAKFGAIGAGVAGVIGGTLVKAALESEKVMKQTEAIVKATGGAANLTSKQVGELSRVMSVKTGIDDEAIQSSMNLLLTFKAVRNEVGAGNDIFNRASMAALDLGNVFGSTDAAAKQLGKALSDPVKGVSALKKAGVDFTDAQRKQIKAFVDSGNVLAAQKLILKEVESQVGGTAAATATDFDRMKVAVGNVAEDLGTLLLPAFEAAARFVTENLVPIFTTFSDIVGEKGVGAGFKYLAEQILGALGKSNKFKDIVFAIVTAFVALNFAVGIYTGLQTLATIAMAAFGTAATGTAVAMNAAFFGIPALVGAVVVIIAALALRFKGFRDFLSSLVPAFKFAFNGIANIVEFQINNMIRSINLFIRAYNLLPFVDDVKTLDHVSLGFDKVAKSVGKVASAADFRKFEGFQPIDSKKLPKPPKTPVIPTGGGSGKETSIDKAKKALDKYTAALKLFGQETKQYKQSIKDVQSAQMSLANATDDVRVAQDKFNKISKGYGAGSKEAAVATRDLEDAQRSAVRATISLRDATKGVTDAQKALDDLKSGKAALTATEDLAYATQKVEDARKSLADAYVQGGDKTINDAAQRLSDAYAEQKDAIDAVRAANDASTPEAITKAEDDLTLAKLDLVDAQNAVKDANQDVIDKQNELHDVISGAATDSQKYKDAQKELTDAQNAERDAVDSLTDAYDKQAEALLALANAKKGLATAAKGTTAKQERSAQETTGIDPKTGLLTGSFGGVDSLMSGLPSIDFSNIDWSKVIPFMADGGIVNKPTLAMIGESGSEAVIPLSQMGNTGGINITVNTGVGDPVAIGKSVVDALQAYQRRSGALQIKVA